MVDAPINGRGFTIKQLFSGGHRFGLDQYQREYSWSRDDVRRLLDDLWRRFSQCWDERDELEATSGYTSYFLGSYVYYTSGNVTYLVDGQQRITTLHLLLIQLCRFLEEQGLDEDAQQLKTLTSTRRHGRRTFTVDIPERADTLEALLKNDETFKPPENASLSVRNLWERSRDMAEDFPPGLLGDALPYFTEWLLDRVCLVGIQALGREHGWEIFETMNDRGRRLSPVDLLKGFLLENAPSDQRNKLNDEWRGMLTRLAGFEGSTGSDFMKALLLAKYADLDDGGPDQAAIDRSFHEWIRNHADRLGLRRGNDFVAFVRDELVRLSDYYCTLLRATEHPDPSMPAVYYNATNGVSRQFQLILAAVKADDDTVTFKRKARLVSGFLDLVFVRTFIRGNAAHPSELDETVRQITPQLRSCTTVEDVARVLGARLSPDPLSEILTLSLSSGNYRQIRYFLARLTAFVEDGVGRPDRLAEYLDARSPWQIEHIWANRYERYVDQAPNRKYFDTLRNKLGALLLLPRSDNASFRDDPYEDKLKHYFRSTALAASLHPDSHGRGNPDFRRFLTRHQLADAFRPFPKFDRDSIESRLALYQRLAQIVWNPEALGFRLPPTPPPSSQEQRTKTHYGVGVSDLIKTGLLTRDATLTGRYKNADHTATVLPDGRLRVSTGEVFTSLSSAGAFVRGGKACAGWDFWHLQTPTGPIKLKLLRSDFLRRHR